MKLSESVISVPEKNLDWLPLLLLMFACNNKGQNPEDFFEDLKKQEEEEHIRIGHEKEIQRYCNHIEWEQDMNATISFCKLDGDFCNMQCVRR